MTEPVSAFVGRSWSTWTEPEVIEVDGVPTAYRREGDGPTTVFLHAEVGTRGWFPLHQELAKSVDLIAPEHPGFGDTPLGAGFDEWTDWVLHYEGFFRALGLGRVHLIGDSVGAWIAANLAAYYPDRFGSVSLIAPLGLRLREVESVDAFRLDDAEKDHIYFNGRQERYADLLSQENELEDAIQALGESTALALLTWNPRYDRKLDTRLQRVIAPTLVLGVEEDRFASNRMAERYAELIPDARLTVVEGADGESSSHRVALEQPADVADVIARHIIEHD
ncbi:alpha/beta hydrolase [Microbacterium sp. A8/3-1]|uniref:Alpha/beta hydrolase n=1 Tax=Microbacterium sp. A8/3-1 TaxID=3160749 RepID=A0AAU7VX30_9MICO